MSNIFDDQADFMFRGDQTVGRYNRKQVQLYESLIAEEFKEFFHAVNNEPLQNQVKEAIDLIVVTAGFLHSVGVDPQKAWDIVHTNNLLKVTERPEYDAAGKILKSKASMVRKEQMMLQLHMLLEKS